MKELTQDEWSQRLLDMQNARKIFISTGLTKNISVAFEVYQELLADEKLDVFVSTMQGKPVRTPMDLVDRPQCDDCNLPMRMKINPTDKDSKTWATSWACMKCGLEYYSDKTPQQWYEELKNADKQINGGGSSNKSVAGSVPPMRKTVKV